MQVLKEFEISAEVKMLKTEVEFESSPLAQP